MAVVQCREPQEMLRWLGRGDGSFPEPHQGRDVVAHVGKGKVFDPDVLGEDVLMGDEASQFEIAVVDAASGIRECDEGCLDRLRESCSPEHGTRVRYEPDTTHTLATGIDCAQPRGVVFDDFFQSGGPGVQFQRQGGEVVELVADRSGDADAVVGFVLLESRLESREETPRARNGQSHAAQFPDHLVPSVRRDSVMASEFNKDIVESLGSVLGQLDCAANSVEEPAQHGLSRVPHAISFSQFLEGGGFLLRRNVWVGWLEDLVKRVEEDPCNMAKSLGVPLCEVEEIIDKDVHGCQRAFNHAF